MSAALLEGAAAVFFDAVGTLIHPEPSAAAVYAAVGRRFGSRLEESEIAVRFRAAFQREDEADRAAGLRTSEARELARWRSIVRDVLDDVSDSEACFQELFAHFARAEAWRCAPETKVILEALSARGYLLGIASNFDRRLRDVIAHLPELRPIRRLVISSEIGWRKPTAAFFAAVCQLADAAPERIVYVGDDLANDYQGGRAAGLRVVLLSPFDRPPLPAADRIKTLRDLLQS